MTIYYEKLRGWGTSLKARGGKIAYYHCQKRDRNGCPSRYVEMEEIEGKFADEFKNVQFTEEFVNAVVRKTREMVDTNRANSTSRKQGILNQRLALEGKRNKLDVKLDPIVNTVKRQNLD